MDTILTAYYRDLLKNRFIYFGSLVKPTIFVDSAGEHIFYCGSGNDFMQLFVNVENDVITNVRYSCFCIPEANVAVEVLCNLIQGKSLDRVVSLKEEDICRAIGSEDEEFRKKAKGILQLLNIGIARFRKDGTNVNELISSVKEMP